MAIGTILFCPNDRSFVQFIYARALMDRVTRGVGNPCPLVLIGLPASIVHFPVTATVEETAAAIEKAAIENTESI